MVSRSTHVCIHQNPCVDRICKVFHSTNTCVAFIGVVPVTQYTHVRNKNSNTQVGLPNVVKVISGTAFKGREVPILKRDVIVERHCLMQ